MMKMDMTMTMTMTTQKAVTKEHISWLAQVIMTQTRQHHMYTMMMIMNIYDDDDDGVTIMVIMVMMMIVVILVTMLLPQPLSGSHSGEVQLAFVCKGVTPAKYKWCHTK